ncbi:MAG: histidine phosphatase family protein [Anaerolineae bacterium]|nr:histidine phosphatase family protein [Anaerolineae bacterium]MCI0609277.1 histidine phosphatase family protein [Anaerolineae bacterium]
MKTIEIRRHSIRQKPGDHLSQQGVTLARLVGQNLGPFDRVVTSTLPRAFETAIAMGFAVDEQNELMSTYGNGVESEAPWPLSLAGYAEVVSTGGAAAKYANQLVAIYTKLANYLADRRAALVINHGGVLEMSAVACLPQADHFSWGSHFEYCEGVRLFWEDDKFVNAEILRVSI